MNLQWDLSHVHPRLDVKLPEDDIDSCHKLFSVLPYQKRKSHRAANTWHYKLPIVFHLSSKRKSLEVQIEEVLKED